MRPDGQLAPPLALHPVAAECFVTGEARRVDDRVDLLLSRPVARDRVRAHVDFSRRVEAMQRPQEQLELPERRLRGQGRERVVAVRLFCGPAERVPARRRHDEDKGRPSQPHPETATGGGRFWGSRRTNRQRRRIPAPVRAAVLREMLRGKGPSTYVVQLTHGVPWYRIGIQYTARLAQFCLLQGKRLPSILDCSRAIQPDSTV